MASFLIRSYIFPIALYSFQLWFYNKAPLLYLLKKLRKIQRRVAIWILGTFQTSSSFGIEVIVGLIPIYLHLCKLHGRAQLRAHSLSHNYILQSLLESRPLLYKDPHYSLLDSLSPCQWKMIKGPIVDMDNRFNKVFLMFDSVTNFIQLVSPQPVDWFSQTKLHWKASNEGYLHICGGRYKSDNK